MQVFRLVNAGVVDKLIAFKSLPKRLLNDIRTRDIVGLPRFWGRWLDENECVRDVFKTETEVLSDRNHKVTKTAVGTEPCLYVLDYVEVNKDKEKWQEISNFVRRAVDTKTRLLDRLEDMAVKMAENSHSELNVEPEDIPVIEIPAEFTEAEDPKKIVASTEEILTPHGEAVQKRRGRPKKVLTEA